SLHLNPAGGFRSPASDASVDQVAQGHQRNECSYHRTPSFRLSCHINSQITSQVLVGVFTLEICFSGVYVSFVTVVNVYVDSIFGHGVTSSAGIFWGAELYFRYR
ncbi:MAG: hypothetical protein PVI39_12835, partial [Desulfobacteraceae bacterium]